MILYNKLKQNYIQYTLTSPTTLEYEDIKANHLLSVLHKWERGGALDQRHFPTNAKFSHDTIVVKIYILKKVSYLQDYHAVCLSKL